MVEVVNVVNAPVINNWLFRGSSLGGHLECPCQLLFAMPFSRVEHSPSPSHSCTWLAKTRWSLWKSQLSPFAADKPQGHCHCRVGYQDEFMALSHNFQPISILASHKVVPGPTLTFGLCLEASTRHGRRISGRTVQCLLLAPTGRRMLEIAASGRKEPGTTRWIDGQHLPLDILIPCYDFIFHWWFQPPKKTPWTGMFRLFGCGQFRLF